MEVTNTIGRRKTAVARVYVQSGSGVITVNNKDYKEYFKTGPLTVKSSTSLLLLVALQETMTLKLMLMVAELQDRLRLLD
jgi:ribosomal protein S9